MTVIIGVVVIFFLSMDLETMINIFGNEDNDVFCAPDWWCCFLIL